MNEEKKAEDTQDKLASTEHTLFKKSISAVETHVKGNTYKKKPAHTQYRFFVNDFMEWEKGLHEIYNELWDASEDDKLELRINSNGGMVNEGAQFYSIIKNKFNGRCTTILDNKGYSMGALIFSLGDERIISEYSDMMYHTYSGGVFGKSGEIESRNNHTQKHLKQFFKDIIVGNRFLSKKEFEEMLIGKDFWFGPEEMCKRGIATHVLLNGKKITAKKYLKLVK